MTRFSSTVGTRPGIVHVASAVGHDALTMWSLRVHSAEVWDAVRVDAVPTATVREVKRAAMSVMMSDAISELDAYVVKLRGIEIVNEQESLRASGALDGSTLLIMARCKRAVR